MLTPSPSLTGILAVSLDAVVVIDETGLVVGWNSNAEQIFGYAEAEALHRQVAELIIPVHSRAAHFHSMGRYLNFGEVHILGRRVKLSALHKDGHEFPVELAVTVTSADGNRYFVSFIRDLTRETAAAAKIKALNTEVLQLSRLNAMGTAASMLAHELNQPLAAASNYLAGCKQLASGIQNPEAADVTFGILKAQDSIKRAADVVKVVRQIVAKQPTARSKVQLQALIHNSMRLIGSSLPVQPVLKLDPDAKYVVVNKGEVEQVLLNIFKNANEAVRGRPNPTVICCAKRDGDAVEICIRDNGAGLTDEARENLFAPFKSNKKDGLGIGLSICRAIIEQHGGRLWTESDPSGTAFCFTVPAS